MHKNTILFLNAVHFSLDDRVFYHQAQSVVKNQEHAVICSSIDSVKTRIENIDFQSTDMTHLSFLKKILALALQVRHIKPNIIICDSPIAVFAAFIAKTNNRHKIIYDITEWYPSKKNLITTSPISIIPKAFFLILISVLAGILSDKFIFGEYYKSIPFKKLFFWKKSIILPYYPNLKYLKKSNKSIINNEINLLYAGFINKDKGIVNVFNTVQELADIEPNLTIKLNIIGKFTSENDSLIFNEFIKRKSPNIIITRIDFLPFKEFCNEISKNDICLDLRQIDFENNRCLPIKLFYYIACGKPVIYSNLKSIQHDVPNFNFGYLCNPNDSRTIASHITNYINEMDLYQIACKNAIIESTKNYNWELIEKSFLDFIRN